MANKEILSQCESFSDVPAYKYSFLVEGQQIYATFSEKEYGHLSKTAKTLYAIGELANEEYNTPQEYLELLSGYLECYDEDLALDLHKRIDQLAYKKLIKGHNNHFVVTKFSLPLLTGFEFPSELNKALIAIIDEKESRGLQKVITQQRTGLIIENISFHGIDVIKIIGGQDQTIILKGSIVGGMANAPKYLLTHGYEFQRFNPARVDGSEIFTIVCQDDSSSEVRDLFIRLAAAKDDMVEAKDAHPSPLGDDA